MKASPGVHVATPGAPFHVGQGIYISYYTEVGENGMANVYIDSSPPPSADIWGYGPAHIMGGLAYDVTAPGVSTPGTYYAGVLVHLDGGGTINGYVAFQVVGGSAFDFSLSLSPASLTVRQGETASYQILITYSNPSYSGTTITVQGVTGLGPGMNYQIIPSPPGLRISTSQSTPTGTYNIILSGSAMGVMRQASASLTVQAAEQPFDFSVSASPPDRTLTPGGSVSYTVAVNLVAGTAQTVALSVPDAPAGVSVAFSQTSGSPPFTSTLTVSVPQSVSPGKYGLTVTGNGGGKSRTAPVALIVMESPDFRIDANPPSQTVSQGQTASYSVNVVSLKGFSSQVSLMVTGLPAGVNGVFSVPSSIPDFPSTLTLTIPSGAPTGSFTLTITGTGGGINRIANVVLVINPAAQTQTQGSQSTATQTGGGPSTPSGLLETLQQNSLLVVGMLGVIIILLGVLALRGRRPAYAPPPPQQTQPSRRWRGQRSHVAGAERRIQRHEFCSNCGQRLR